MSLHVGTEIQCRICRKRLNLDLAVLQRNEVKRRARSPMVTFAARNQHIEFHLGRAHGNGLAVVAAQVLVVEMQVSHRILLRKIFGKRPDMAHISEAKGLRQFFHIGQRFRKQLLGVEKKHRQCRFNLRYHVQENR